MSQSKMDNKQFDPNTVRQFTQIAKYSKVKTMTTFTIPLLVTT
jgi:hypothetical protein